MKSKRRWKNFPCQVCGERKKKRVVIQLTRGDVVVDEIIMCQMCELNTLGRVYGGHETSTSGEASDV